MSGLLRRRVVVTGIGIVSPLGLNTRLNWECLLNGGSGLSNLSPEIVGTEDSGPNARLSSTVGGVVTNFDPKSIKGVDPKRMARFTQFAMHASYEALENAGLNPLEKGGGVYDPVRAGCSIGSGIGAFDDIVAAGETIRSRGPSKLSPFFIPSVLVNLAAGNVAIQHGLLGPNHSASTACATGVHAIGDAYRFIRDGDSDMMVCGATEASISRLAVAGFGRMKALSTQFGNSPKKSSRPFDAQRNGFVIAEGAAMLVLEEENMAKQRGAPILAYVSGYGMSGDGFHITSPSETGDGARRAMEAALWSGGLSANDIDYVNAHATSTPMGDRIEGLAMHELFKNRPASLNKPYVSSTKGHTGHLLGAAGAIEAAFSILALKESKLIPTRNLTHVEDDCMFESWEHVNVASSPSENEKVGGDGDDDDSFKAKDFKSKTGGAMAASMCNSFGFGGTNASIIFTSS
jgi:3-oxoacyl-[acyl-carrier-protein] synthase II